MPAALDRSQSRSLPVSSDRPLSRPTPNRSQRRPMPAALDRSQPRLRPVSSDRSLSHSVPDRSQSRSLPVPSDRSHHRSMPAARERSQPRSTPITSGRSHRSTPVTTDNYADVEESDHEERCSITANSWAAAASGYSQEHHDDITDPLSDQEPDEQQRELVVLPRKRRDRSIDLSDTESCRPLKAKRIGATQGRPKAKDFSPEVQEVISIAIKHYRARLSTEDPYPDLAKESKWTKLCWEAGCRGAELDIAHTTEALTVVSNSIYSMIPSNSMTDWHARQSLSCRDKDQGKG